MKIIFPTFNRVHESRQKLLLDELAKGAEVHITTYGEKDMSMVDISVDISNKFRDALDTIKPDLALIRGDRYEMLAPAMLCAYRDIPIAHIEGFDLSGVIDNKVRYAISHLSNYHFVTNEESYDRARMMGFKEVYNYGSLDVEFAKSVKPVKFYPKPYIMALWHPIPNESGEALYEALKGFQGYDVVGIKGNKDYEASSYKEEYSPEEFVNLLREAHCLVGNSSAGIKEASILGTPAVNIGNRQENRLKPVNVLDVPYEREAIIRAIEQQLNKRYEPDHTYFKENTSINIATKLLSLDKK